MHYKTIEKLAKTNKKSGIPILQTLKAYKKRLTATDMDFWISAPTSLKKGTFHAEGFSKGMTLDAGLPVEDFPECKEPADQIGVVNLTKKEFDALEWVAKAQSTEETRYYLNGMCFQKDKVIATDGHRLHGISLGRDIIAEGEAIFPRTAFKYLLWLCKEVKDFNVRLEFFENMVFRATVGEYIMDGKLIDGTFPQWQKVVPEHPEENVTFYDVDEMQPILEKMNVLRKLDGMTTPAIALKDGIVKPSSSFHEHGKDFAWTIQAKFPEQIGFNAKYAADVCSGVCTFGTPADPVIIRDRRGGFEKFAVLMPLRV